jgi:hypothetical protein
MPGPRGPAVAAVPRRGVWWLTVPAAAMAVVCLVGCLDALVHMFHAEDSPGAVYRSWAYHPMLAGSSGGLLVVLAALGVALAAGRRSRGLAVGVSAASCVAAVAAVTWGVTTAVHRRDIGPYLVQEMQELRPPSGLTLVSGPLLTTDDGVGSRRFSAVPEVLARWHPSTSGSACQVLATSLAAVHGWTATPGVCGWHRTRGNVITRVYVIPPLLANAGDVSVATLPRVMGPFT